ncbi:RapZ C-terminal domain-containing protein [Riemerella columbipharyngis]|uniref:UPF0042 nucleotide-binding protein n=1 Tax=Riemerella columbipharyngis TaxID=1071918 RepID=A0A1G7CHM3_9FLAO|nr:RNase adapter RapZ [Riemerella columbipharyngis]SDE38196.1 UPF0042 nucleotide-binding protein [Riemerella columbipharyngis]
MEKQMTIKVYSFSYKKGGIPRDTTDNGGGFVFDCRGILNPGRLEEYKSKTGAEQGVQQFLEEKTQMPKFIQLAEQIVSISIENYLSRDFKNLQISFGCTGGQHRSVYAAIKMSEYIRKHYPEVKVELQHNEQPQLN